MPDDLPLGRFGPWQITRRRPSDAAARQVIGWDRYTLLCRHTLATLHRELGEVVMEDSAPELRRHLAAWMGARGRVLVTGLGLGCVVRGLLASPAVEHVDVVEIDRHIIRAIGPEFAGNPRVAIHHADALAWEPPPGRRWDLAWHDIWTEGDRHLQLLHAELLVRYSDRAASQGAWAFPREMKRRLRREGVPHVG